MMKQSEQQKHRELLWRRAINPRETSSLDAWLASHPEAKQDAEDEQSLTRLLEELPDIPVSSNFTALVLLKARQQSSMRQAAGCLGRLSSFWKAARVWFLRASLATGVAGLALLGWFQHEAAEQAELASTVQSFSRAVPPRDAELLQDYEVIQHLSQVPALDVELLAALQ